jgi:hypothetical protein
VGDCIFSSLSKRSMIRRIQPSKCSLSINIISL